MSTNSTRPYFLLVFFCLFGLGIQSNSAQTVLYMELMKEEKPIKYYEGQTLSFKSTAFPDEWQNVMITRIIDEEKIITYDGGLLKLDDITAIRRERSWPLVVGYGLQTFGFSWLVFGGLAHFTTDNFDFGVDTAVIGGTALATGWIVRKFFRYKKYKIGRRVRLKILDLSWK